VIEQRSASDFLMTPAQRRQWAPAARVAVLNRLVPEPYGLLLNEPEHERPASERGAARLLPPSSAS
jgi:hypothetical protein